MRNGEFKKKILYSISLDNSHYDEIKKKRVLVEATKKILATKSKGGGCEGSMGDIVCYFFPCVYFSRYSCEAQFFIFFFVHPLCYFFCIFIFFSTDEISRRMRKFVFQRENFFFCQFFFFYFGNANREHFIHTRDTGVDFFFRGIKKTFFFKKKK